MTLHHVYCLTITLLIYILLGLSYFGWGLLAYELVMRLFYSGRSNDEKVMINTHIWFGWGLTLLIFQVMHLFFAINILVVIPILSIGMFVSLFYISRYWRDAINTIKSHSRYNIVVIILISIAIFVWVVSRSMISPVVYDSGLYHFNAIRWINTFPIVRGLGNLHGRLAFNQTFFIYAASVNFYPLFGHGRSIANSFLLLLTILSCVEFVVKHKSLDEVKLLSYLTLLLLAVIFFIPTPCFFITSHGLDSPSPDLASTLLQLMLFLYFAWILVDYREGRCMNKYIIMFIVFVSSTAVTIKLSNAMFCLVIVLILFAYMFYRDIDIKTIVLILIPSVFLIILWIVRGIILSGAPLYPSTIGYMSFLDWAMPKMNIINEANWIYSWARQPHVHWSEVLGSWKWITPWLQNYVTKRCVIFPLFVFIIVMLLNVVLGTFSKKDIFKSCFYLSIAIVPVASSAIFWFFTAPDVRFANATFVLLVASAVWIFLCFMMSVVRNKDLVKDILVVLAGIVFSVIVFYQSSCYKINSIGYVSLNGWQKVKHVPLVKRTTKSGLVVYTPERGDQCWDSPLPCTPYFNDKLRLLVPGDLSSGFTVKDKDN